MNQLKRILKHIVPWLITVVALYYAFRGIEWQQLFNHVRNANVFYIVLAGCVTICSYLLRSWRWQYLFPELVISYLDSAKVLFLGFFMNNVLPARAGELVRAHAGSKVTNEKRTLVLATIFSERLADGLTLSIFFMAFAFSLGDKSLSRSFSYVALAFAGITIGVIVLLFLRNFIFVLTTRLAERWTSKASSYALNRIQVFIDGLSPLCHFKRLPYIALSSIVIWLVELSVYILISLAYNSPLALSDNVLFLVAVNFSSLIPAAPGGIGVIEAVTATVLVSLGVDKEQALAMVMTQHIMQYVLVGIPGALSLLSLRSRVAHLTPDNGEE